MEERKYEKYIIDDLNTEMDAVGAHLYCLDGNVFKGAPYVDCGWYMPRSGDPHLLVEEHQHSFGEVVTFFGSNPEDPSDLCGEIEFWIGGEQYLLTRSCIIYVPPEVKHCPLIIRRVDRPIFHFATASEGGYSGPETHA